MVLKVTVLPLPVVAAALLALSSCSPPPSSEQLRPPPAWFADVSVSAGALGHQSAEAAAVLVRGTRTYLDTASPTVAGPPLAAAIRFSRAQAAAAGLQPPPAEVEELLRPHFRPALLARVRWVLAGRRVSLGSLVAGWFYDEGAVTLDDVIVFSDDTMAHNIWLWAHELAHVEQYERLGVGRFSYAYASNWRQLETAANRRADEVTTAIRRATPPRS